MGLGLFRMMAALARDIVVASTFGSAALLIIFLLGGFIVPKGIFILLLPIDCVSWVMSLFRRHYPFLFLPMVYLFLGGVGWDGVGCNNAV